VIDQLLDMGRTATNILGNAIATAVIGRNHDRELSLETGTTADSAAVSQGTMVEEDSREAERVSAH
jgi:Na+/H+-dicarboxylate symporter